MTSIKLTYRGLFYKLEKLKIKGKKRKISGKYRGFPTRINRIEISNNFEKVPKCFMSWRSIPYLKEVYKKSLQPIDFFGSQESDRSQKSEV